jgi:DNA-binding response OmpR family regulator
MDTKNIKIAFVDDGEMILELSEKILNNAGFTQIQLFDTGGKFLEYYEDEKNSPPDIVFLDIKLPDIDGLQIIERVRRNRKFTKTIFISLSEYIQNIDEDWLKHSGFDGILVKPFVKHELISKVETLIRDRLSTLLNRKRDTDAAKKELEKLRLRTNELENKFIKKLISPEVFEILESNPEELNPTEQEIAVGFVDIRGFKKLYNMVNDAPRMGEILEIFFDFTCEHITKGGGFVDKFIGDEVMWFHKGAPIDNISKQCIDVAVTIIKGMNMVNEVIRKEVFTDVQIGVGIGTACGKAMVGILGAPNYRIQYSALGSAVNLAAYACKKARRNEIIIGGTIIKYCPYKTEERKHSKGKLPLYIELRKVIIPE